MTFPYGVYAYSQLPDEYDHSVADPFAALLASKDFRLIYLIELYPYDSSLTQTINGAPPYGVGAYSQFGFEILGGVSAVYLSDQGFVTEPGDMLSSKYFIARVDNPLQYESSVHSNGEFGAGSQSFGSVVITNGDGKLDALQQYYWNGRRVVVKAGAPGFRYSDFAIVFDGAANGLESDEDRITITIQDNRIKTDQLLQPPFYAGTGGLEGGSDIANKPKPLCFGEVRNAEPVLVDSANLIYQIHDGSINGVIAVRDSGVLLTNAGAVSDIQASIVPAGNYVSDPSRGYIKLGSTPSGRITVDLQGENTGGYISSIGSIVARIVKTRLGANSLDDSQIDLGSLARLDLAVPGSVGIYLPEPVTASEIINDLINPVGAYWSFTRQGQLQAGVVGTPTNPTITITENQITDDGVRLMNTSALDYRITVGYAPASTVQNSDELLAGTTATDRAFVSQEYRYLTYEDGSVLSRNAQAVGRTFLTRLANQADAQTPLSRVSSIYAMRRKVYQVTIFNGLFRLYIGDTVKLVYNRFGMQNGLDLLIIGISEDAETGLTTLELWG